MPINTQHCVKVNVVLRCSGQQNCEKYWWKITGTTSLLLGQTKTRYIYSTLRNKDLERSVKFVFSVDIVLGTDAHKKTD